MADDLFAGRRFRPGPAKPMTDEDSGFAYRSSAGSTVARIGEVEILAAVDQVPSLPTVVSRILTQVGKQHSSAADLEELIKQDMVIAGRLLKMVNSPFYGLTNPVASITQAVAIIGFASLKSLVLAASTASLLVVDLAAYGFTPQGLWKNSISTAALARDIAKRTGVSKDDAEEYFVAGLLRDVGMLVLGPFLAKHGIQLRRDHLQDADILYRERRAIGFDHCWVGDRLAEKWRLPAGLTMAIGKHHRIPTSASAKDLRQLAAVRVAERLVYAAGIGVLADHPFDSRLDGVLIHTAGLDQAAFQKLMADVPGILAAADKSLV
jgi:HD-like signal output (HDOD) protein